MSPHLRSTATLEDEFATSADVSAERRIVTFVVLWCTEPWRIGEVMLFPATGTGDFVFGRGGPREGDPGARAQFARSLHSDIATARPLEVLQISRVQALLNPRHRAAEVDIKNLGRAGLTVNGSPVNACRVRPGDLVQFGRQIVLLCVHRSTNPVVVDKAYPEHVHGQPDAFGIVGESEAVRHLRRQLAFVGPRTGHVLIHGPSGAGKELAAHAIHGLSRSKSPMVSRNAATLPEGLIDAELFGNVRNYPNPGMPERPGLLGQADGSTLYLDEFAELPAASQTHLLRVLDCGEYQRLGDAVARRSNFRLVASTNRPTAAIKEDLFARLHYRIEIPDLNQRREDIPCLLLHLLRSFREEDPSIARFFPHGGGGEDVLPRISLTLLRSLVSHRYRTNVRELRTMLWTAIQHSDGDVLQPPPPTAATSDSEDVDVEPLLEAPVSNNLEREQIRAVLERHNGHMEATWRALGLKNRYALRRLLEKHGIEVRRQVDER